MSGHPHSSELTSGMKPISLRWLLSSGSWKAIIWEKTVKYSEKNRHKGEKGLKEESVLDQT